MGDLRRAFYFLLAGAAARFRYLQPGLAITLAAVGVKMLTADLYHVPTWASPVFIAAVLAVVIFTRSPPERICAPTRLASIESGRMTCPAH